LYRLFRNSTRYCATDPSQLMCPGGGRVSPPQHDGTASDTGSYCPIAQELLVPAPGPQSDTLLACPSRHPAGRLLFFETVEAFLPGSAAGSAAGEPFDGLTHRERESSSSSPAGGTTPSSPRISVWHRREDRAQHARLGPERKHRVLPRDGRALCWWVPGNRGPCPGVAQRPPRRRRGARRRDSALLLEGCPCSSSTGNTSSASRSRSSSSSSAAR
jgi:hypothetical protein